MTNSGDQRTSDGPNSERRRSVPVAVIAGVALFGLLSVYCGGYFASSQYDEWRYGNWTRRGERTFPTRAWLEVYRPGAWVEWRLRAYEDDIYDCELHLVANDASSRRPSVVFEPRQSSGHATGKDPQARIDCATNHFTVDVLGRRARDHGFRPCRDRRHPGRPPQPLPAGGRAGTTVDVTFTGSNGGLEGAIGLVIDGPPGVNLYQWPDVVGVWGPGTTAAFVVELHRLGGLKQDVEVAIEGLPEGWTGSSTAFAADEYRHPFRPAFGHKQFLTITAPADAAVGTVVEFRVVGRTKVEVDDREIVHAAKTLNQLSWQGEPNRFRPGITSRAVVARPQGVPLESEITDLTAKPGATVAVPLRIAESADAPDKPMSVSVNRGATHFECAVGPPVKVTFQDRRGSVKFTLPSGFEAGHSYEILVSDAWTGETRKSLPGPCTRPVCIHVAAE